MRLGGWVRIAMAASVIWTIVGTLYIGIRLTDDAAAFANGLRSLCEAANRGLVRDFPEIGPKHTMDCGAGWQENYEAGLDPFVKDHGRIGAAVYALGALLLVWVLGGLTFVIVWWIRSGFKRTNRAGWQRVGIVASVAWAIGGGLWGNNAGLDRGKWAITVLEDCLKQRSIQPDGSIPTVTDWKPCNQAFHRDYRIAVADHGAVANVVGIRRGAISGNIECIGSSGEVNWLID